MSATGSHVDGRCHVLRVSTLLDGTTHRWGCDSLPDVVGRTGMGMGNYHKSCLRPTKDT